MKNEYAKMLEYLTQQQGILACTCNSIGQLNADTSIKGVLSDYLIKCCINDVHVHDYMYVY